MEKDTVCQQLTINPVVFELSELEERLEMISCNPGEVVVTPFGIPANAFCYRICFT
jgi:hypothetical protein